MNIQQFFKHLHVSPIFKTTRELKVVTKVWIAGSMPDDPKEFTIPAGTELRVNSYSNFGDGYSMSPIKYRAVFSGKNAGYRFFNCPYDAMEFVRYQEGN